MTIEKDPSLLPTPSGGWLNLFSGLRGKGVEADLDLSTSVLIPMVAAMLADGRVEEEELQEIHLVCETSPIFQRNSLPQNDLLIARATKIIEDIGIGAACERARQSLSPALRETAYVHAMRVIFSDGHVGQLEREVADNMIEWLEIDRDRARMMVEVVSIMQHPSTA
jgi:uncharacterized tellurite resistance protein B-like protein